MNPMTRFSLLLIGTLLGIGLVIEVVAPSGTREVVRDLLGHFDQRNLLNRIEQHNRELDQKFAVNEEHYKRVITVMDEVIAGQLSMDAATEHLQIHFAEEPIRRNSILQNYPASTYRESLALYILDNIHQRLQRSPLRNEVTARLVAEYVSFYGREPALVLADGPPTSKSS
jgi:hypothetical protein